MRGPATRIDGFLPMVRARAAQQLVKIDLKALETLRQRFESLERVLLNAVLHAIKRFIKELSELVRLGSLLPAVGAVAEIRGNESMARLTGGQVAHSPIVRPAADGCNQYSRRMTASLYYDDPSLVAFSAAVVSAAEEDDGQARVILDQTAFYPEGGGQPADRGVLAGATVIDVKKSPEGIVHLLKRPKDVTEWPPREGSEVHGEVDWDHRRDYMQQHSGQHVLSAALLDVGDYNTVSVHQGEEYTTIEVDSPEISSADLREVERRANDAIEADLPITAETVHESNINSVRLRRPPKVSGDIRVVRVGSMDCVACGGVHCERTGQIRLIRLVGVETIRGHVRTAWKIGDRALRHFAEASEITGALVAELSAKPQEIVQRVRQLGERVKGLEYEVRGAKQREYDLVTRSLLEDSEPDRGQRVITAEFTDEASDYIRGLAEILVEQTGVCACLTNRADDRLYWCVGVAAGARFRFEDAKADLLSLIAAKGGGRPPIWQGVGAADGDVQGFLAEFKRRAEQS